MSSNEPPVVSGSPPPSASESIGLPRQLGFRAATLLTIGSIVGAGIFRVPGAVAAQAGSPGRTAFVWAAGGGVALCGALSLAELGAMFPRAGGVYVYVGEAYGPVVAFLCGWTALVTFPASAGALATVCAEYLGELLPLGGLGLRTVAAIIIIVVTAAVYRSTRAGSLLQGVATMAKLLALALIVALAFAIGGGTPTPTAAAKNTLAWSGLGPALLGVLYAYSGWQGLAYVAGEVRDPGRTLSRALVSGVATVVAVYLAVNAAYAHVVSFDALAHSRLVAADVMRRVVGPAGTTLVSALIVLSAFGTLTANTLSHPRLFYAMAEDRLFFPPLAAVHPRYRTPHIAVAFIGAVAVAFVSIRTFEQLAEIMVLGFWPFLTLAVMAVPVLRHRRPDLPRPYRAHGYPVVQVVFVAASLALIGSVAYQHPVQALANFGFTLLGIPVYVGWRVIVRRHAAA